MIVSNGKKISNIYSLGKEISRVYSLGQLVWEKVKDYSETPFTVKAVEDGVKVRPIKMRFGTDDRAHEEISTYKYSKNGGDWVEKTSEYSIKLNKNETLSIIAVDFDKVNIVNGLADIYGNIMSLLYGDNFVGQNVWVKRTYETGDSFFGKCDIRNAKDLILPATTLSKNAYEAMFRDCISLISAPELPATELTQACYNVMFENCVSLKKAPKLPATTLKDSCYQGMFNLCSSLIIAPELPATELDDYCYNGMFRGCISLTTAPELPATSLHIYCYGGMFENCTSLTTAPELPATILAQGCYNGMFSGCSSLSYIKCLATRGSVSGSTINWVKGVATNGTFVKSKDVTWETGYNGIPSTWTIEYITD